MFGGRWSSTAGSSLTAAWRSGPRINLWVFCSWIQLTGLSWESPVSHCSFIIILLFNMYFGNYTFFKYFLHCLFIFIWTCEKFNGFTAWVIKLPVSTPLIQYTILKFITAKRWYKNNKTLYLLYFYIKLNSVELFFIYYIFLILFSIDIYIVTLLSEDI